MIYGLDLLGAAHPKFDLAQALEYIPEGWALGVMDCEDTFGRVLPKLERPKIKKLLKKFVAVRFHAHWSPNHVICSEIKLRAKLGEYQSFATSFPGKTYLSHSCEYSEKNQKKVEKLVRLIEKLAPACIPVNSAMPDSTILGGTITERHGSDIKSLAGDFVSSDGAAGGTGIVDMDVRSWLKKNRLAEIVFLWAPRFNLRQAGIFIPPLQRAAAPSTDYINGIIGIAQNVPVPTTAPVPGIVLKYPVLWKPYAEDKVESSDLRPNKPVFICPEKRDFFDISALTGERLGKMTYYGTFPGGLHRYYSGHIGGIGLYGWQIAEHAAEVSKCPYIWLRASGNLCYGPILPYRRQGHFRE